jgi:hypothetical protein
MQKNLELSKIISTFANANKLNYYIMEPIKIDSYLNGNLSVEQKVTIINAWEEERGGEAEEAIFDLFDNADDIAIFSRLYGEQSLRRCRDIGRFWIGGLAFYDNVENRVPGVCPNPIKCYDNNDINNFFNNIIDEFGNYIIAYLTDCENVDLANLNESFDFAINVSQLHNDIHNPRIPMIVKYDREWELDVKNQIDLKEVDGADNELWWKVMTIGFEELWMDNYYGRMALVNTQKKEIWWCYF